LPRLWKRKDAGDSDLKLFDKLDSKPPIQGLVMSECVISLLTRKGCNLYFTT
jgi:hypothetical protein